MARTRSGRARPKRRWKARRSSNAAVEAAANVIAEGATPFDDAYASAWYRRAIAPVHLKRLLLA